MTGAQLDRAIQDVRSVDTHIRTAMSNINRRKNAPAWNELDSARAMLQGLAMYLEAITHTTP
jgi:hypothetical protein